MKEAVDPLPAHAGWMAVVGLLGLLCAYFLPLEAAGRRGALLGVALAVASGAFALHVKRRAVARSLQAALFALGAVFGLRLLLLAGGLWYVSSRALSSLAFTVGFFVCYFALQAIEVSYVLAEHRRLQKGAGK